MSASAGGKGDATRARILTEATDQASVRGLAAVSLQDVAEAVGLSKSGLFKHFRSKEALHLAVLATAADRFVAEVWAPAQALPRGRQRMDVLVGRWIDWVDGAWTGGCPLMAAARELDAQPGSLRDYVRGRLQLWIDTVAGQFQYLTQPPAGPEVGAQAAFELNGILAAYKHARSFLGDAKAREKALAGYQALATRVEGQG